MNTLDQLYIRACKSMDPLTRIQSIHRRFFLSQWDYQLSVHRLAHIIEEYDIPFSIATLVQRSSEEHYALFAGNKHGTEYYERVFNELVHTIRYTKKADLPTLTIPVKFRG